jgi:hypothetical protein
MAPVNPPMNLGSFDWSADPQIPGRFGRDACGLEIINEIQENQQKRGSNHIFHGVEIASTRSISPDELRTSTRLAWQALRWELPTIAGSVELRLSTNPRVPVPEARVIYDSISDQKQLDSWANQTVQWRPDATDIEALRFELGEAGLLPSASGKPGAFLYIVPRADTSVGFLLYASHVLFDASGARTAMTRFLRLFSDALRVGADIFRRERIEARQWGQESENLIPASASILDASQHMSGIAYEFALQNHFKDFFGNITRYHGCETLSNPNFNARKERPQTKMLRMDLSRDETVRIRRACEAGGAIEEDVSVTELRQYTFPQFDMPTSIYSLIIVNGTVAMIPILDNPPAKGSDAMIFFNGLIDARAALQAPYNREQEYAGNASTISPISIPVSSLDQFSGDERAMTRECIRQMHAQYQQQAQRSCQLSIATASARRQIAAQPPSSARPYHAPIFSSDGRAERHLQREYSGEGAPAGSAPLFIVADQFVSVNVTDPSPSFRAQEWDGRISLTLDFNTKAIDEPVAQAWLQKWKDLTISVLQ